MSNSYVVVDDLSKWDTSLPSESVISFSQYLEEHPIKGEKKTRIINLCDTKRYLSRGYYCSLLAEARNHKVLPSVNTLNDLRNKNLYLLQLEGFLSKLNKAQSHHDHNEKRVFNVYFGISSDPELQELARQLFERFPTPILAVTLVWRQGWQIKEIKPLSFNVLEAEQRQQLVAALDQFKQKQWRSPRRSKASRWDMAILVNQEEKLPPSDAAALKKMQKAAAKVGINAEFIGPQDYARLGEYDALFIRETTEIDHHTYHFARKAEIEGMVVIDDPTSILRCCNKVYLQDAFSYSGVPTLKTIISSSFKEQEIDRLEQGLGYPMVLKIPNSSFSVGVLKVADRQELKEKLQELLAKSALVIAQEYRFTEYDWRIGVLNHRPLYACRYYMAKGHWQIYQHGEGETDSGSFETLPTYEVPKVVIDAALKAARIIGDGLYGIDIKQKGNRVYVIEVNDNPSLDQGVEDLFLGDELYMQIMSEFARRLEKRGR